MAWFDRKAPRQAPAVTPLTRVRLRDLFDQHGWKHSVDDDGDIRARFNGDTFYFILSGARLEILNVLGYMPEDLPMSLLEEARAVIEDWRRDHLWPGLFWRENDDAGLTFSVGGAVAVDWEDGVTDDQLVQHIRCGIGTCNDAFAEVRDRLGLARIEGEIADAKASQYDLRAMSPQERSELVAELIAQDEEQVVIRLLSSLEGEEPGMDDELRDTLALAYSNTGRYDEALGQLELLGPTHQDDARWHYRRGCVLHRLAGQQEEDRETVLLKQARQEYRTCLALAPGSPMAQDCAQFLGMLGEDATAALFSPPTAIELRRTLDRHAFGPGVLTGEMSFCARQVPVEIPYGLGAEAERALAMSLAAVRDVSGHDEVWHQRLLEDPGLESIMNVHLPDPADAAEVRGRLLDAIVRMTFDGESFTVRISDAPSRLRADLRGDVGSGFVEATWG